MAEMRGPTFKMFPARMHADVLRAMVENGVDLYKGNDVLDAYAGCLCVYLRALKASGCTAEQIDFFADWIAKTVKSSVNQPEPQLPKQRWSTER